MTGRDPYAKVAQHLVRIGVCTQFDLTAAFMGPVLNAGLAQGWLTAEMYDQLATLGGDDPTFMQVMKQIECRVTTDRSPRLLRIAPWPGDSA